MGVCDGAPSNMFLFIIHIDQTVILKFSLNVQHVDRETRGPWVPHLRMTDQWSGTICDILVECIMRNNFVKIN